MNIKYSALRNLVALALNLLIVYVLYTFCRIVFLVTNANLYPSISFGHIMELLCAGIKFDSSAIIYTNSVFILLFLIPLHLKERPAYYKGLHWFYVISNMVCLISNLVDTVYFPFTGRRTTNTVFAEFENEGAGNIVKIFAEMALDYWPLCVVAIVFGIVLWYCYFSPQKSAIKTEPLKIYYPSAVVVLLLFVVFSIGQIRGGYTKAIRPITISNAKKYADSPAETGAILNTPFSFIRTMDKKPLKTPDYMPQAEADRLYMPLKNTNDTLRQEARKLNVVVLIMESFSKQHYGFYNDIKGENGPDGDKNTFTPFLDSLIMNSAYTFKYSYANGRKSIEGMPSTLASIPGLVEPYILTPASMNSISGIARELTENWGYRSAFFHGAENGSMGFDAFANATGFQKYFGRTEYYEDKNYNGKADFDGTWAIFDEEFLQYYCDRMNEMEQPFMTSVFTATSHSPFTIPARYKGHFPKGKMPIQETVAYSDNGLRNFFEKAKKQSWFNNTLFVITADHTSGHFDPFYNTVIGHYCVPIIFYAPSIEWLKGYDDDTVVEQTDIMPTVLGLLGYDKPYVAFGQDIFNTPKEEKHALHWVTEDSSYEFIKGRHAMIFDGKEITAVYDYRNDLLQTNDIKDTMSRTVRDSIEIEMKAVIQQYMRCMNNNQLTRETYLINGGN